MALQLGLGRPDVVDLEGDVAGAETVREQRPFGVRRRRPVLQQLQHGVAEPQADLAQRGAGHADALAEAGLVEPRARLGADLQAEQVVVEADGRVEIPHGDPDVALRPHVRCSPGASCRRRRRSCRRPCARPAGAARPRPGRRAGSRRRGRCAASGVPASTATASARSSPHTWASVPCRSISRVDTSRTGRYRTDGPAAPRSPRRRRGGPCSARPPGSSGAPDASITTCAPSPPVAASTGCDRVSRPRATVCGRAERGRGVEPARRRRRRRSAGWRRGRPRRPR